jgi:hypothetical protein
MIPKTTPTIIEPEFENFPQVSSDGFSGAED